jgi:hypothetical protein
MTDHNKYLTEYLIDELRYRDIVLKEYLLETIVEIALYYFGETDSDDENELNNYIYNSLINVGYVPKQWIINHVTEMILNYMDDNELLNKDYGIVFTFEDDEEEE